MAMSSIHSGNQSFLDEEYAKAIEEYGQAISLSGEDEAVARSNRAGAYLMLNRNREALQDASAAVKMRPTEIAFYRKGVASFALEEFETSLEAFRQAQQAAVSALGSGNGDGTGNSEDPREYRRWIRKCEAEMEAEETAELPRQDQKSVAELGGGANGGAASATPPTVAAVASRAPVSSAHVHLRTKFQYYQSYEKVTVAVLEKGLKEAEVEVDVLPRRLTVRRKQDMALLFDKVLYEEVLAEKKRTRFMTSKLEITLTKKSPADWPELEGKGVMTSTATAPPKAPLSDGAADQSIAKEPSTRLAPPYASTKNWDVVEKEVEKELDAEKPQGEEALNNLFKQIYGNADEDTRRAMVKSMQTSGGTVLSTNWDEVGKSDYEKERQAPKGMEWRTWEGQKLPQKSDDDN